MSRRCLIGLVMLTSSIAFLSGGTSALRAGADSTPYAENVGCNTGGCRYVSLGDSFSAGAGLTDLNSTWPEYAGYCDQGEGAYPKLIWERLPLGSTWNDLTCSGATSGIPIAPTNLPQWSSASANVNSWAKEVVCPSAIPRGDHRYCELGVHPGLILGPKTQYVTITIGGDDLLFAKIAQSCMALQVSVDGFAQTANLYNSVLHCDQSGDPLDLAFRSLGYTSASESVVRNSPNFAGATLTHALETTYAKIHAEAPAAHLYVVGYPSELPQSFQDGNYCPVAPNAAWMWPTSTGSVRDALSHISGGYDDYRMSRLEVVLNDTIQYAVKHMAAMGDAVSYVDMQDSSPINTDNLCHDGATDGYRYFQVPTLTDAWQAQLNADVNTIEQNISQTASDASLCVSVPPPFNAYWCAQVTSDLANLFNGVKPGSGPMINPGALHPTVQLYQEESAIILKAMKR